MNGRIKRAWDFLQEDSWPALIVTLVIALVIIKFIFFPTLSFLTGTKLPLVIVESCSMHHHAYGLSKSFKSPVYKNYGLSLADTKNWAFQNGFNKGDVIFVVGPKNIKVGDIIVFNAGIEYPIIHRVIRANGTYSTKGDNDITNYQQLPMEKNISKNQIIGKALFRIPFIGWAKLIFYEPLRSPENRGMCR